MENTVSVNRMGFCLTAFFMASTVTPFQAGYFADCLSRGCGEFFPGLLALLVPLHAIPMHGHVRGAVMLTTWRAVPGDPVTPLLLCGAIGLPV